MKIKHFLYNAFLIENGKTKIAIDPGALSGIKATHGPLTLKFGPFSKTVKPGHEERVGWGAIGYKIKIDGKTIVNLGDTIIHEKDWAKINNPEVLMLPIGGRAVHNTMDEEEALQAVKLMRPKLVIPCHYNCPAFFSKKFNPADDQLIKREVDKMGMECSILKYCDEIEV